MGVTVVPFDSLTDNLYIQRAIAVGLAAAFGIIAFIYWAVMGFSAARLRRGRPYQLAGVIFQSLRTVGAIFLALLGVFLGLAALPDANMWRDQIFQVWSITLVVVGSRAAANILSALAGWYAQVIAPTTTTKFDDSVLPLVRRFLVVIVYGIAALIVLDTLGVSISPLLGGLGISGLAVALALQPTLSNFFAGAYVLSEGMVNVGDYIELTDGPAGYVVSIGWRSTKIRTWLNNYVIIPNAVMSDTIVMNYSGPDPKMNILVTCGVSYDSDLERVNEVALEVARGVIADNQYAVKTEDPWFGFDRFGDSNVDFWLFLQAHDRVGSFVVTNELIKRLHARFRNDGIEINYPVRKLVYDGTAPVVFPGEHVSS